MRHSSLMLWSATPVWNTACQVLAKDQNVAGTWARIAWLSGRGVPSRAARTNSAFMASSTVAGSTYEMRCLGMDGTPTGRCRRGQDATVGRTGAREAEMAENKGKYAGGKHLGFWRLAER